MPNLAGSDVGHLDANTKEDLFQVYELPREVPVDRSFADIGHDAVLSWNDDTAGMDVAS